MKRDILVIFKVNVPNFSAEVNSTIEESNAGSCGMGEMIFFFQLCILPDALIQREDTTIPPEIFTHLKYLLCLSK